MSAERKNKRKSMAAVASSIGQPSENWLVNQAMLVFRWKAENPFQNVDWEAWKWDVAASYEDRTRGSESNGTSHNLLFTVHSLKARVAGAPLIGAFADVVKALVCSRHSQRGQSVSSHMVFIRGTRYVYDELHACGYDVSSITTDHLNRAVVALFAREAETSAYKVVAHIEEFADVLDSNGLCRIRLDWRYRGKQRPKALSPERIEDALPFAQPDDRLPREEVIRAVGYLYQTIPAQKSEVDSPEPDRIVILISTILVCTGLRIGEVLTLPEHPLFTERDGTRCIRYLRLKGRNDAVMVEWRSKPLLSATVGLVEDVVNELHQLTQGPRTVARSFHRYSKLFSGMRLKPLMDGRAVMKLVRLNSLNVGQFLKIRKIPYRIVSKRIYVDRDSFLQGVLRDHWTRPMVPGPDGTRLELHKALCVAFANQMHRGMKTTLRYAAQPVAVLQVRDFLTARTGTRNIFDRYSIVDDEGQPINVRSKGFRHFLNNLLDEGGAPDMVQTKWFGRKHARDTKAYQHLTSAQRAKKLVDDILAGNARGRIVDIAKVLPVEVARAFLTTRIQAVHDVGPGMCIHDFQMMPCPRHLQCTAKCDEFVWKKGDEERKDDLLRQVATTYLNIKTVRAREADGALVHADWMKHLQTKHAQLMKQMATANLNESDIEHYIEDKDHGNVK